MPSGPRPTPRCRHSGSASSVRSLAEERLPSLVRRLSLGQDVDVAAETPPLTLRTSTLEVARIAAGFAAVQRTAVGAAVGQAEQGKGVSNIFRSLARRNQSLFRLGPPDHPHAPPVRGPDHLVRCRARPPLEQAGATGDIEDYVRVDLVAESEDLVAGTAVADLTHLLAELIENAVLYSPPNTRVQVKTGWGASGFIVEIEDSGLGIPVATMDELNRRLTRPPEFDLADSDQLGLLVVSRLAERHEIKVTLRASPYGGVAAIVLIPKELVVPAGMGTGRGELSAYPDTVRWPDLDPVRAVTSARSTATATDTATPEDLPRRTRQASLAPLAPLSDTGLLQKVLDGLHAL